MPEFNKDLPNTSPALPDVHQPSEIPPDEGVFRSHPVQSAPVSKHLPEISTQRSEQKALSEYRISQEDMAGPLVDLRDYVGSPTAVDSIVDGLEGVQLHTLQGLARPTLINFMEAADLRDMILFTRFVEPISKTLIEEGWPTKHYRIKTKSANWGLQSGTIPTNQAFSKKAGDPSKVESLNEKSQACLKDTWEDGTPVAISIPLKISSARIRELEEKDYLYGRECYSPALQNP